MSDTIEMVLCTRCSHGCYDYSSRDGEVLCLTCVADEADEALEGAQDLIAHQRRRVEELEGVLREVRERIREVTGGRRGHAGRPVYAPGLMSIDLWDRALARIEAALTSCAPQGPATPQEPAAPEKPPKIIKPAAIPVVGQPHEGCECAWCWEMRSQGGACGCTTPDKTACSGTSAVCQCNCHAPIPTPTPKEAPDA